MFLIRVTPGPGIIKLVFLLSEDGAQILILHTCDGPNFQIRRFIKFDQETIFECPNTVSLPSLPHLP